MPATYEPISSTTLSSAANSITFSSIPSTYTDLRLVLTVKAESGSSTYVRLQFNSDTGSNYSDTFLDGYGTGIEAGRNTTATSSLVNANNGGLSSTNPSLIELNVFSYTGSTNKTTLVAASNDFNGSGTVFRSVSLWRNTSAINAVKVFASGTYNFATGTTATLYGIL